MKKLVEMELDSIKFSFQGADEGTCNEMREGGDYNRLLGIIREMSEIRGDRAFPYIQISTTLTGETAEQIESFKQDIQEYCDYYNVGYTQLNYLNVDKMNINDEEKEKIRALQKMEKVESKYKSVCPEAFDKLSANWNGDVTLCCSDCDNFMVIGNILDGNLEEIFTSKAANLYRDIIVKNKTRGLNAVVCAMKLYQH